MEEVVLFIACISSAISVGICAYLADENQKRRNEIRSLSDVYLRVHKIISQLIDDKLKEGKHDV